MVHVWGRLRSATSPGWVTLHFITLAAVVTMVLLGRWQLDVSNSKHFNLQNFGYALQWWAFSVFALVMWVRVVRDGGLIREEPADPDATSGDEVSPVRHPTEDAASEPKQVEYRRYVMPTRADAARSDDSTLGAYNDYLAGLAADDERKAEGTAR